MLNQLCAVEAHLLLQAIPGLGPRRIQILLENFLTAEAVFDAEEAVLSLLPQAITAHILAIQHQGDAHPFWQKMLQDMDYMDKNHIHILQIDDELYPSLLKEVDCPPPLLYVKGDPWYLSQPQLAVVGARKASQHSLQLTYQWSQTLANKGLVITSGLALGVDGAAHQGAIDAGKPTIAILAHGLDSLYPRQHRNMALQIESCGALVTEFALGAKAQREHFPRRNRIISGLSQGLLVTEAAIKSGSMISAQYAIEQNRDVFAVPGQVNNAQAAGCHVLIQQGANLTTSPGDILQALNWQQGDIEHGVQPTSPDISEQQARLLKSIPFEPTHIDSLIKATGLSAAQLSVGLLELELLKLLECIGGNYQRIQ